MRKRIYFTAWGLGDLICPAYAYRANEYDTDAGFAAGAIAMKNKLYVINIVANCTTKAGTAYSATLGKPCQGGGWTPTDNIWFEISREV